MGMIFTTDKPLYDALILERKKRGMVLLPSLSTVVVETFIDDFQTYIIAVKTEHMVNTGMDIFTYKFPKHAIRYKDAREKDIARKIEEKILNMFAVSCEIEEKGYFIEVTLLVKIIEDSEEEIPLLNKVL
jgi:hypothetical protein